MHIRFTPAYVIYFAGSMIGALLFAVAIVVLAGSPHTVTAADCTPAPFYRGHLQSSGGFLFWQWGDEDYLYTTSAAERDNAAAQGWTYESIAGYIFPGKVPGSVPLYRSYSSPGSNQAHFYTTSAAERDGLPAGYTYEGVAGYVFDTQVSGSVPFYRLDKTGERAHFYTTSAAERDARISQGWQDKGIAAYIMPTAESYAPGQGGGSSGTVSVPPQSATCTATLTVGDDDTTCPPGQKRDPATGQCIPGTLGKPSITLPAGQCVVGVPQTYTVVAHDSDTSSRIRYGFDWTSVGPVTQWVPSLGYVPQGTSQTVTHTWDSAGSHSFRALAEDSQGNRSPWSDVATVVCRNAEPGPSCSPTPYCSADGRNVCHKSGEACVESCTPCAFGCTNGACNPPPEPEVVTWSVAPKLVHKDDSVTVSWTVRNVSTCTVTGTNGDTWTVAAAGSPRTSQAVRLSSGIVAQTTFTLHCTPYPGASWTDRTAKVNVVPAFKEE
jgi:hypothetical protein